MTTRHTIAARWMVAIWIVMALLGFGVSIIAISFAVVSRPASARVVAPVQRSKWLPEDRLAPPALAARDLVERRTWVLKDCYKLEDVTNFLNTLPPEAALEAKVLAYSHGFGPPYYVWYRK